MKHEDKTREFSMHYCSGLHANVVSMTEHKENALPHTYCMSAALCHEKGSCEHTAYPASKKEDTHTL